MKTRDLPTALVRDVLRSELSRDEKLFVIANTLAELDAPEMNLSPRPSYLADLCGISKREVKRLRDSWFLKFYCSCNHDKWFHDTSNESPVDVCV